MLNDTDHIQITYLLRAPLDRAWRAISHARQFEAWFGAEIAGQFAVGARLTGRINATKTHPGIGRAQQPYRGSTFEISIHSVVPMRRFSFRWRPLATGQGVDYPPEPVTLVTFDLTEAATGTVLTITESGIGHPAAHGAAGPPWTEQAVARCLWRPREIALLVEKLLAGAFDLRPPAARC
jgi:uncharacterized protein YndB with AHSA1/START domain